MQPNVQDIFSNANAYEAYVGRWSRAVAPLFITWVNAASGRSWLDVGAGTGILTQVILDQANPSQVLGVDLSPEYLEFARQRVRDARATFSLVEADRIAFDEPFDIAVAGLVLNFVPSPERAVQSMMRSVRDGGMLAAYVWDYSGRMEMMRSFWDAAGKVDPVAKELDAGQRFAICHPDALRALFETAGLEAVEVISIDIETRFRDFDDYWLPFLGAQGSVSKYLRSLSDETLSAVREQLRSDLPTASDGSIALIARAWAVKGQK